MPIVLHCSVPQGSHWVHYCIRYKPTNISISYPFIHSFIPDISIVPLQVHYYSQALPTTASIGYCVGVNTPKCCRQLRVKDLPEVTTWRLEWDSNLRPSRCKAPNLPLSHHALF